MHASHSPQITWSVSNVTLSVVFWWLSCRRDGAAPGDPIKSDLQQGLFTAGELAALLAGQRGIALVQLWNGWDASKGQPLYNPCAITMLERVLAAPGVAYCSSLAPGGESVLRKEGPRHAGGGISLAVDQPPESKADAVQSLAWLYIHAGAGAGSGWGGLLQLIGTWR